jgi:co-chaperonin GroES (HSP10)
MKVNDLPAAVLKKHADMLKPLMGLELPTPAGWFLLCVQYVRADKTAGGIIIPGRVKDEDKFQGRCGLVVAMGPAAYKGDKYGSPWCKIGDWVAWPALENAASRMEYAGMVVTAIPDDRVVLVGVDPELVS